jgi:multicomponent K+:H+ antiporter subunit G
VTTTIIAEVLVSLLVLVGAGFVLVGSIGLVRLPELYTRLHAPTKATTLGVGAIILGAIVFEGAIIGDLRIEEVAISLFLFMTAPLSAHLVAKAAARRTATKLTGERPPD